MTCIVIIVSLLRKTGPSKIMKLQLRHFFISSFFVIVSLEEREMINGFISRYFFLVLLFNTILVRMFNKYFILLVAFATVIYVLKTNADVLCLCSCCDGAGCDPIYEGNANASSCDGLNCVNACKETYPFACNNSMTGEISATCQDGNSTTVTAPTSTSSQTSQSTISTTQTTSTQHSSSAFIVRESPSFIALLITSLFTITKLCFKTIN